MNFGQTIRNVAGGVGSAVRKASAAVDAPFVDKPAAAPTPTDTPAPSSPMASAPSGADANGDGTVTPAERRAWEVAGHALTPSSQGGRQGFELPDIENPTDSEGKPNPFYIPKTRKNAKGVDEPNPDYTDASAVHRAMETLDRIHTESNPHIDFAKEYADITREQQQNDAAPPRGIALSAFAIALGAGPQAAENYHRTNQEADQSDDQKKQKALEFKKSLVDAHVKQLVEEGKWKEALRANEVSTNLDRLLSQSAEKRKHDYRMEENAQLITGRNDVAQTQANSRLKAAQIRVHAIGTQNGLTGAFMTAFEKEMGKHLAGLTTGLTNDPDSGIEAIPGIMAAAEEISARLKKEQDAQGGGDQGGDGSGDAGKGKKKVQMFKGGKPFGAPISPEEFTRRGGAAAAQTHGYTFKMQ